VEGAGWVKRHTVTHQPLVTTLERDLDVGEAESIALALELKANLILLDEKEARHAAQRLGLKVMGVIGVLIFAHAQKEIKHVRPYLDSLRQEAGFYLSEELYHAILEQIDEN
jgi:predicted nucleic acid-binding protein